MRKTTRATWTVPALLALLQAAPAEMVTFRVGAPPEGALAAGRAIPRSKPPVAYVARAPGALVMDGRLDEPAWKQATKLSLARTLDGRNRANQPTTVLLLRDAGTLYVGIRCTEPRMGTIRRGRAGKNVEAWTSDSVEFFLGTGRGYCHFGVNPAGGTYDGRGKNSAWDLPLKAAVALGRDRWTVEAAVPLARISGKKVPKRWIANFNRTRYAGGSVEEYAWSPTFSGDSHVPGRFGKLMLADPPARESPPDQPRQKVAPVQVLPVTSGAGVVRMDLSALPGRAKIHRADLRLCRSPGAQTVERLLTAVEVYPLPAGLTEGEEPKAVGKPLTLRGPGYDRLDATAAVRAWARRRGKASSMDFFVKAAPPLHLAASCLEIVYEGKPRNLPGQVKGVKAFHRAGQTFITWKDPEDAFGNKPVTWGKLREYFGSTDPKRRIRYRVYRHSRPIGAANVKDAVLLAEVRPLSGFNINSWSLERLINQVVFSNADEGELGVYGPFSGWSMDHPQGGRLIIPRFAIEDGKEVSKRGGSRLEPQALPTGTGLYVHSASGKENAHYAVTAVADGVENLSEFSAANAPPRPVAEAPAAWEPVEQPAGGGFGFDFRGKRHFYVTWAAPPLAPRPMYFNWSALVPPDCKEPRPVELYFHAPGHSYARPPVKFLDRSIQICPHDYPFSGWYGYNDAAGTLQSPAEGVVRPYTVRRIEAFLKWAQGKFPIDTSRMVAVGGDGAALMALHRPELFAYVLITRFEAQQLNPKAAGRYNKAWGPASPRVKDENGLREWLWGELDYLLCSRRLPAVVEKDQPAPTARPAAPGYKIELPLFVCRSYSWGRNPAYGHGRGRFYYALQATRHALHAHWAWGGRLTPPNKFGGLWQGLDIQNSTPVPAITNSSADREGEGEGNTNVRYVWSDLKDSPEGFEVGVTGPPGTLDLTPRRLSKFRVRPGRKYAWEAVHVEVPHWARRKKPEPKSGLVTADANGLITLNRLEVATGYKLVVRIKQTEQID